MIFVMAMDSPEAPLVVPTLAEVLASIEEFLLRHDMAPTRFGRLAMGDGALVGMLREGRRDPSLGNIRKICAFMAEHDAAIALCDGCDRRAYDPVVKSCLRVDCPMKAREARAA
jgi:hypothetical protein